MPDLTGVTPRACCFRISITFTGFATPTITDYKLTYILSVAKSSPMLRPDNCILIRPVSEYGIIDQGDLDEHVYVSYGHG